MMAVCKVALPKKPNGRPRGGYRTVERVLAQGIKMHGWAVADIIEMPDGDREYKIACLGRTGFHRFSIFKSSYATVPPVP